MDYKGKNFTLITWYWLVPGTDLSMVSQLNINKLRALWKIDSNIKLAPLLNGDKFSVWLQEEGLPRIM